MVLTYSLDLANAYIDRKKHRETLSCKPGCEQECISASVTNLGPTLWCYEVGKKTMFDALAYSYRIRTSKILEYGPYNKHERGFPSTS